MPKHYRPLLMQAYEIGQDLKLSSYNHSRFSINVNYVVKNLNLPTLSELDPTVQTGNYRLNFIYKIQPGPKFTKTYTKYNPVNILTRMFQKWPLGQGEFFSFGQVNINPIGYVN